MGNTPRSTRPKTWPATVHDYVTAMKAAGRSPGTIRLHRHYLNQLYAVAATPWGITSRALLEVMAREDWSPESRKSARAVYRGFFRWCHGMGYADDDPALALPSVRVVPGPPRPAPELVVEHVITCNPKRVIFMAQLAAFGGLRCAEIARVHEHDLADDVLLVHGKGGKRRLVPIEDDELLARLRLVEGYAFPNPATGAPLTPGHVSKLLSDALPGHWTAHTLRHRYATRAVNGTGDLLAVMKLLGHARPETTMRYTELADERLRAAARATRLAG